jgi:sterol desaturase/sphingolipid hydroxylase (fatty acid hydroxylase superfamily)
MHHTNVKCNYGFYFTFWDRVMKTLGDFKEKPEAVKEHG